MSTLFVAAEPVVEEWLERRRALGHDRRDEMWEGVYHVAPFEHSRNGSVNSELAHALRAPARRAGLTPLGTFNLGSGPRDFRIPDLGWRRGPADALYVPDAALVIEVLSPGDESWNKLDFYAAQGVEECWMVDPIARTVQILVRAGTDWPERPDSPLLGVTAAWVVSEIDWP